MTIGAAVTRELLREEKDTVDELAADLDWEVDATLDDLVMTVTMESQLDSEVYIVELECANYDEEPPYVEMIHPDTGERGVPAAYFDDRGTSPNLCYPKGPAWCHQFNRKLYQDTNAHNDWSMAAWKREAGDYTTLGSILLLLYRRMNDPESYQGRLQA